MGEPLIAFDFQLRRFFFFWGGDVVRYTPPRERERAGGKGGELEGAENKTPAAFSYLAALFKGKRVMKRSVVKRV